MPAVVFYISGHGFGHAVRQTAIINALRPLAGDLEIVVRTSAPAWLFARTIHGPCTLVAGEADSGVLQIDSLRLDERRTMQRAVEFYETLPQRVEAEAALLRAHAARLVVADAPPLACAAAGAAGIPSVVCSNFTWDWIYQEYTDEVDGGSARRVISTIQRAYAQAAAGWRMPMHGGFETIGPLLDLPLVARQARADRSREDVRHLLGLPRTQQLALVSFGGYGVRNLPFDRLDCTERWGIVVAAPQAQLEGLPGTIVRLPEPAIYARGLHYEDLVRAVDVVVTKPGYGIISDCVANDTAILYTTRGKFAEYDVLVREMPRLLRSRFISREDLLEGRWNAELEELERTPAPPHRVRTDGAAVAAGLIVEQIVDRPL